MIWILLSMFVIVALACLVVVYVAFPHRGADVPSMPWVGRLMRRGVKRLPTIDNIDDPARRARQASGR